jgi:hypothetical protein
MHLHVSFVLLVHLCVYGMVCYNTYMQTMEQVLHLLRYQMRINTPTSLSENIEVCVITYRYTSIVRQYKLIMFGYTR